MGFFCANFQRCILNTHLKLNSGNGKTGPIAVSTTSWESCPKTCGAWNDCYARKGYYTRMHGDKVTNGDRGTSPDHFIKQVSAIRPGTMFRHNVSGDLWHVNNVIDKLLLNRLIAAVQHLSHAWTYTHHVLTAQNLLSIRWANKSGFTINVSVESEAIAAKRYQQGLPVCCITQGKPESFISHGVQFKRCENQLDGVPKDQKTQCIGCGNGNPWCSRADRNFVIAFELH